MNCFESTKCIWNYTDKLPTEDIPWEKQIPVRFTLTVEYNTNLKMFWSPDIRHFDTKHMFDWILSMLFSVHKNKTPCCEARTHISNIRDF